MTVCSPDEGVAAQYPVGGFVLQPDLKEPQWMLMNEALCVAIGQARVEFEPLFKTADGAIGGRSFKYAPLGEMVGIMEKALAKHGVGFVMPISSDGERVTVELIVQGHGGMFRQSMAARVPTGEDKGRFDKPLGDTWVQELGRITTYLRRYLVNSFFALDTVEDKDTQDAEDAPKPAARQRDTKAETPREREAAKAKEPASEPKPQRPSQPPSDLAEALGAARKNLAWDKEQTLSFIAKNFNGKGSSELSDAEKAQLLGMMEDLYAATRANGATAAS